MHIDVGDLVVFKYEQSDPKAKIGLVLKRELRITPKYTACSLDDWTLSPLLEKVISCYCLWAPTENINRWWTPEKNLITIKERNYYA